MKKLKVIDGKVELHGKVFKVDENNGSYLAVDFIGSISDLRNDVYQFKKEPTFGLQQEQAAGMWTAGISWHDEHLGELNGIGLEQCASELYQLDFDSA